MGTIKTPEHAAHWTSADGLAVATTRHIGTTDGREVRNVYQWSFYIRPAGRSWHNIVACSTSDDDIRSGVNAAPDATEALGSLASFIGAWHEAYNACGGEHYENCTLFSDNLMPWADSYAEEFSDDLACWRDGDCDDDCTCQGFDTVGCPMHGNQ